MRAIRLNGGTALVLNHLDLIDGSIYNKKAWTPIVERFVSSVEDSLGTPVTRWGTGPSVTFSAKDVPVYK
jgi:adenylosuccinate synthase